MKRRAIAAGIVAGATLPLLAAALFLFGCCVLPFHDVMHKMMPACHLAASVMSGQGDHPEATPPAREKQEPVKRLVTARPRAVRLAAALDTTALARPAAQRAYRSFIAHGALRCDRDVGLHVLVRTFLI